MACAAGSNNGKIRELKHELARLDYQLLTTVHHLNGARLEMRQCRVFVSASEQAAARFEELQDEIREYSRIERELTSEIAKLKDAVRVETEKARRKARKNF